MGSTDKVAVSLDPRLLSRAEALRQRTGESRSALFARALRKLLDDEEHQRRVEQYVAAYRQQPESAAAVAAARATARRSLAALPWDDS